MRDVQIKNEIGVLSDDFDHSLKLKVGMIQKLVFGGLDIFGNPETGSFWWSAKIQAKLKYDEDDEVTTIDLLVAVPLSGRFFS